MSAVAVGEQKQRAKRAAKVPLWVRAVQGTDRLAWYAYRAQEVARDELLCTWVPADSRHAVTAHVYARQEAYLPGGTAFETGLFDWENRVLSAPPFPTTGRILLGAAGGGRELRVLCERGFEVVAFEPNDTLRAGAEAVAKRHPKARVIAAAYDDLVAATTDGTGPLAETLAQAPFDAVVLGWGSLTHLLTHAEHVALLRAARRASPGGPVLASFFVRPGRPASGKGARLRRALRRISASLGANVPSDGVAYEMNGGFVYFFTEEEILTCALEAGHQVASFSASPFPHALLVPLTPAPA